MLVPILYYGIQLALAPLCPGYDFRTDVASLLGSDRSPVAAWFNIAVVLSGIAAIAGATGVWQALSEQSPRWIRILLAVAMIGLGLGNIWAGIFVLPDPRHGGNPFAPAFFVMPALLFLAAWTAPALNGLRFVLSLNLLLFLLYALTMAGFAGIDRSAFAGWLQRFGAFTIMGALGLIGLFLLRREARQRGQTPPRTSRR